MANYKTKINIYNTSCRNNMTYRWSKTIVGQVDLTAKLCLSFCLELQSVKSTYQHVDLDL